MIPTLALALLASSPAGAAEPAPFVGLPLRHLPALGLDLPSAPRVEPASLRYPLRGGGFAILVVRPTAAEAELAFDGMARTLATHWPEPSDGSTLPGDRALGDGAAVLLARSGNAALFVRDAGEHAADVTARILGALATDEALCAGEHRIAGDREADGCGRPR